VVAIAGADFFMTEVWTWRGLVTVHGVRDSSPPGRGMIGRSAKQRDTTGNVFGRHLRIQGGRDHGRSSAMCGRDELTLLGESLQLGHLNP
jgi:hypothetical protein